MGGIGTVCYISLVFIPIYPIFAGFAPPFPKMLSYAFCLWHLEPIMATCSWRCTQPRAAKAAANVAIVGKMPSVRALLPSATF